MSAVCYRCREPMTPPMILTGDVMAILPTLPAEGVHCVVTSPPYFALRSYLPAGHPDKHLEIGSEPTPGEFIETMVRVFREVRRVMHPSGLLFLNLADSYGDGCRSMPGTSRSGAANTDRHRNHNRGVGDTPGQLQNIPHRVAEALRADGWVWRQTIVWAKPAPMPESVAGWRWVRCRVKMKNSKRTTYSRHADAQAGVNSPQSERDGRDFADQSERWQPCPGCPKCLPNDGLVLRRGKGRCTTGHEYVFVLSKSESYFWNSAAFCEPVLETSKKRAAAGFNPPKGDAHNHYGEGFQRGPGYALHSRNPRSVWTLWTLSPEPSAEKHFASYPSRLVHRCLLAGASPQVCAGCGAPWAPVVEREQVKRERPNDRTMRHNAGGGVNSCGNTVAGIATTILGYRPTCSCDAESVPATVLDPFMGTGTTLQVAHHMGLRAIGIDLNPEYVAIAERKIAMVPRCFGKPKPKPKTCEELPLFASPRSG